MSWIERQQAIVSNSPYVQVPLGIKRNITRIAVGSGLEFWRFDTGRDVVRGPTQIGQVCGPALVCFGEIALGVIDLKCEITRHLTGNRSYGHRLGRWLTRELHEAPHFRAMHVDDPL